MEPFQLADAFALPVALPLVKNFGRAAFLVETDNLFFLNDQSVRIQHRIQHDGPVRTVDDGFRIISAVSSPIAVMPNLRLYRSVSGQANDFLFGLADNDERGRLGFRRARQVLQGNPFVPRTRLNTAVVLNAIEG